jgi:hypothetical protein
MAIVSGPTGPGTYVETDPRRLLGGGDIPVVIDNNVPGGKGFDFQNLLNQLRGAGRSAANAIATPTGTKITGLAAPSLYAAGSLMQGDIAQGGGELVGGLVGSQLDVGKKVSLVLLVVALELKLINGLIKLPSYLVLQDALKLILHGKCFPFKINTLTTKCSARCSSTSKLANSLGH